MPEIQHRGQVPVLWFLRLRLIAFLGQAALIVAAVHLFGLSLSLTPLFTLLALIPISGAIFSLVKGSISDKQLLIGGLVAVDTLILTGLLYFSGGPTNPFSLVYLVHVVLAAVLLGGRWAWGIAVFSTLCFSFLFVWHIPIHELHHMSGDHGLSLHLKGMLFSYALVAALVAYFLSKILAELRGAENRLEALAENQRRLAFMTSISTNAAHELGTPLSSIGLIAHEMGRLVEKNQSVASDELREDLQLLRQETERCKEIIEELCLHSGSLRGEAPSWCRAKELVDDASRALDVDPNAISVTAPSEDAYFVQRRPLVNAIKALLSNALDANSGNEISSNISVSFEISGDFLLVSIKDDGVGMNSETLDHAREPFFTTKKGKGMGLGVYIADTVALQLGGKLEFHSREQEGTTAVLSVPAKMVKALGKAA